MNLSNVSKNDLEELSIFEMAYLGEYIKQILLPILKASATAAKHQKYD